MGNKRNILLVEDDESLGYLLTEYLKMNAFDVQLCAKGSKVMEVIQENVFDLIILDVMLPEVDGFTLAEKIKEKHPHIPFIFLTARSLKIDVLKGFYLGAVDYLKKPIDEEELVVRVNTILKNIHSIPNKITEKSKIKLGEYTYEYHNLKLNFKGEDFHLTARENELLNFLVTNINEVCTHKEILNTIWENNDYFTRKSLNVFISRLRKYLERDPSIQIKNIHNQGFVFRINN